MAEPHPLYCDCGCEQVMAMDHGDRIVVRSRPHGRPHVLTIHKFVDSGASSAEQEALKERLAGSTN